MSDFDDFDRVASDGPGVVAPRFDRVRPLLVVFADLIWPNEDDVEVLATSLIDGTTVTNMTTMVSRR